jgi:uncharacterized protein involved in response to NO
MKRINCALFALGFRPFFLLAGLFAVVLMGVWSTAFVTNHALATTYGMVGWHSHEMIFGYTAAVIAGFLLTAVGNWTGMRTTSEAPLAGLSALWLAGRVAPFFPDGIPPWLVALLDLLFLPALALAVAIPLVRSGQRRNLFFISLLGAFALANLLVHLEVLGFAEGFARAGIFLGLDLIILLIVIMGGRVIPFFTERALSGVRPRRRPWVEWLSIASVIAFIFAELFFPDSILVAVTAGLAAASNALRLSGWYTERFWSVPLLWVLHLGYGWIVAGFCLKTLASVGWVSPQLTIHAFTVGGIGVLTLGMMARVSLGHTGRVLQASKAIAIGFALINLAAAARGIAPIFFINWLPQLVALAGGLWILSFAIFLEAYVPILISPRIDGRPG